MSNFTQLKKPLSKYEISETGLIRNAKNKNIVSKEKNGKSVRLIDDKGNRATHNVEELKKSVEKNASVVEPKKTLKEKLSKVAGKPALAKEQKVYKVVAIAKIQKEKKHEVRPIAPENLKPDAKKIMLSDETSYNQIIALFNAGYDKQGIIEITGRRNDVVSKYLRPFLKKEKKS